MTPTFGKKQGGFLLITVLIALAISASVGIYQAKEWVMSANKAQAVATGQYMLTVRGAVIKALGRYEAALSLTDMTGAPPGAYPISPAWATFSGDSQTIQVKDLKDAGLLSVDIPESSSLGRSVYVRLLRTPGICPGVGCEVRAYVVSCWPIAKSVKRTSFDPTTCTAAPSNLQFDELLIGAMLQSLDGFGGTNVNDATRVVGPLMDIPTADLGIPGGSQGHVVVNASLNATLFDQFVRQGDTRQIRLNNDLSVAGKLSTDKGLLINTQVEPGAICADEGMYVTTSRSSWAQCVGGQWFELANHVVTTAQYLANGATVVPPTCPGTDLEPFSYASISRLDSTMTGTDVKVHGDMNGTITGAGTVSQSGNVSVAGTYTGKVVSSPDSTIRVAQGVEIVSGQVVITPASPNARAMVIQGCRYHG